MTNQEIKETVDELYSQIDTTNFVYCPNNSLIIKRIRELQDECTHKDLTGNFCKDERCPYCRKYMR